MITYVRGSLFKSPANVLVNTVNTVGVMGKGIAKAFKEIYPEMFSQYQLLCEKNQLQIGQLWLYKANHKWILNFPTKKHWRQPSKAEYIEEGLKKFVSTYATQGITRVAFPQLGCGNGQLDWEKVVKPLMTKYLEKLPIEVFIYEYGRDSFIPEHEDVEAVKNWLRSEPRSLGFVEVWDDLCKLIGSGLNLTTLDGLADFKVVITKEAEEGLLIQEKSRNVRELFSRLIARVMTYKRPRITGHGDIFIPREAMSDLWRSIRDYGFCVPRSMPPGVDIFAPHLLALLGRLEYMKPVMLSTSEEEKLGKRERGLQLIVSTVSQLTWSSEPAHAVQPV